MFEALRMRVRLLYCAIVLAKRGQISLNAIIGLCVGLFVASATIPSAIVAITNATLWSGAPTIVITLGTTVVGIVAVVALIMMLVKRR